MTETTPDDVVGAAFEKERARLVSVAYRMLGSRADAEDAVQEAWLRLARQEPGTIDNLGGWLTTVVGRVCIDLLRARNTRPEGSYDERLADLVVAEDPGAGPEDDAVLAESVGLALMVVLDALRPSERLAFVLHDMFAVPFEEVGEIIGTSGDAAKMLAWRARKKVRTGTRAGTDEQEQRQQRAVVDAFLAAARFGEFDDLLRVLDPDVTWRTHTARGLIVRRGHDEVIAKILRGRRSEATARRVLVNGEPGIAAWRSDGTLHAVMTCRVADGRIIGLESVTDPARLASIDLPVSPPDEASS
jgi:RNA polymerase sigma factor (sigma-70 family)